MKKLLLSLSVLCASVGVFAQSNNTAGYNVLKKGLKPQKQNKTVYTGFEQIETNSTVTQKSALAEIGRTTYDLQTNASTNTNLLVDANGDLHATWIRSQTYDIGASDRGTGYNVYSNGAWAEAPAFRIDAERTGWPNLFELSDGTIGVVAHTGASGTMVTMKEAGSEEWTSSIIPDDVDAVWNRVAATGGTIHLIVSRQAAFDGVTGGVVYRRSEDKGATWTDPILIPGFTNHYLVGTADSYAIAADGDNVAIVYGDYARRTVLFKSTDGGDTWNETIISEVVNPLAETVENSEFTPTFCAEGVSLTLDTDGNAHVAYNTLYNFFDDEDGADIYYQPTYSQNLLYWNESMSEPMHVGAAFRLDDNGDGDNLYTSAEADANGYFGGLLSHPSIGRDADNNIVIAYDASLIDEYDAAGNLLRDVYLVKSTDGGMTWEGPYNVSNDNTTEAAFPVVPKVFDGDVPVLYQKDTFAGTAVQETQTEYVDNLIEVEFISLDDINGDDVDLSLNTPMIYTNWRGVGLDQGCTLDLDFWGIYAFDYPDGQLDVELVDLPDSEVSYDSNVPGEYDMFITATDSDGNTTAIDTLTITVVEDIEAPVWTYQGSTEIQALLDSDFDLPAVAYEDLSACSDDLEIMIDSNVDTATSGDYTVTYTVTDIAGNTSEPLVFNVAIIGEDVDAPVLSIDSAETVTIEASAAEEYICPNYTAFDSLDGDITDNVVVSGCDDVDVTMPGEYTVTFDVADAAGNPTTSTITVIVADTSSPILSTLAGQSTQSIACGGDLPALTGLFAVLDNSMAQIIGNFTLTESGSIDVNTEGAYPVTYSVADAAGNTSNEQTITYIVTGCTETSIQALFDGVVSVLPNPTTGEVFVDLSETSVSSAVISVFNIEGRLLKEVQADNTATATQIDLSNFADGVYMIQINAGEMGVVVDRIILAK